MRTPLLGRSVELAALDRAAASLASGTSALVEIAGLAGVGRSALVRYAVAAARRAGAVVLYAAGAGGAVVVGELLAQVRVAAAGASGAVPGGARLGSATSAAVIAVGGSSEQARPAAAEATGEAEVSGSVPGGAGLGSAASAAVLALARTRPVLVAVDDGDRLDHEARAWLAALGRRAAGTSLMIVVVSDGVRPVLDDAVVVTPRPLERGDVAVLAEAVCGDRLEAGALAELVELTGGRPRLVREVLERRGDAVGEVVGDAVARAVRSLPVEVAGLARAIAVCGPAFDLDLVCSLVELGGWSAARAVDVLVGAGLVTADGQPVHPVDRVLDGMAPQARQELYARAARLGHRCAVDEVELARIVAMAPPLGEPWVVPLLRTVARRADEGGDSAAAARHCERALREPVDARTRAELTLELAVAESRCAPEAGDQRLARMLLEPQPEGCAEVRLAAADQLLARGDGMLARRTFAAMRATGVERDGITALFWFTDDVQREMPELSVLDVEALPRWPDDPERAGVAAWEAVSRGMDVGLAGSLARFALGSPAVSILCRIVASVALSFTDDLAGGIAGLDAALAAARDRGLPAVAAYALVLRARVNLRRGHYREAAADLALAAAQRPNWHPQHRPMVIATEMLVSLGLGLLDQARELDASVPDSEWGPGFTWTGFLYASGVVALRAGDLDRAIERLEEAGRRWRPGQTPNPAVLPWRTFAAVAWSARGNAERAAELCHEELALVRRWGAPSPIARTQLVCAKVLGDRRHLTEAVELLRDSPVTTLRATALLDLAETVDPSQAETLVREAAHLSSRAGAVELVDRARALGWVPGT